MGIFNSLRSLGYKAYNSVKSVGSAISSAVHKVAGVGNYIDDLLNDASDIPIVGKIADGIRDNAIYQTVLEGVNTVDQVASLFDDRGLGTFGDVLEGSRQAILSPLF